MSALSDYERGVLLSSMTPGSCAMMLGRSQTWVERMRAAMIAPAAAVSGPEAVSEPGPVCAAVVVADVKVTAPDAGRRTPDAGRRKGRFRR